MSNQPDGYNVATKAPRRDHPEITEVVQAGTIVLGRLKGDSKRMAVITPGDGCVVARVVPIEWRYDA